ncbi:hypothetical protein Y094_24260, partial [Salmonella enterica subsp. enterica serovar Tennessee]
GVLFKKRPQGGHDFTDGLRELGLMRVALLYMVEERFQRTCLIHRYKNLLYINVVVFAFYQNMYLQFSTIPSAM